MAKILQTIAGLGAKSGGTSTCTYDLIKAMHDLGCDVDLMTLRAEDLLGNSEPWIKALPDDTISSYGYSRNMNRFLYDSNYDVYHTNGMWMHCNHETCLLARKKICPMSLRLTACFIPTALKRFVLEKVVFDTVILQ